VRRMLADLDLDLDDDHLRRCGFFDAPALQ
jgi:hypothetical protein